MNPIYLDWAATAPAEKEILDLYYESALKVYGNPSSKHGAGREAKELLSYNRERLSRFFNLKIDQIIFTSCGTESNGIILTSLLPRGGHMVTTSFEHASLYEQARYLEEFNLNSTFVRGKEGFLDLEAFEKSLKDNTVLVSVMAVNNETGIVQPLEEIRKIIDERYQGKRKPLFHVDAVQAAGKIPLQEWLPWGDSFSLSGHKLAAPRGCGLLLLKRPITPLWRGGGQENGMRPGTENLAAITATTEALIGAVEDLETRRTLAGRCKRLLLEELGSLKEVWILPSLEVAASDRSSPFILSLSLPPLPSEVTVRILSEEGFYISAGSACSSRKETGENRVLLGLGVSPDLAFSAVRISFSHKTTQEEIQRFIGAVKRSVLPIINRLAGGKPR